MKTFFAKAVVWVDNFLEDLGPLLAIICIIEFFMYLGCSAVGEAITDGFNPLVGLQKWLAINLWIVVVLLIITIFVVWVKNKWAWVALRAENHLLDQKYSKRGKQ
jgi:hypothetical protein